MLLSEFIHAVKVIPYPRRKNCNKYEHSNASGDILNDGDNVDDGFSESYSKIALTDIDEYTKNKLLNLQQ